MNKKVLIVSDNRAGHENQSIAFCNILKYKFDILHITYKYKFLKLLSYFFDFLNIYTDKLFVCEKKMDSENYDYVVTCGSSTYYAGKYLSRKVSSKLIALMYPKGFRNSFYHIFANLHDKPKKSQNLTILPVNISFSSPKNRYNPKKNAVGIVIGGENSIFKIDKYELKETLLCIKKQFVDYEIAITSSPRTSKEVEEMVEEMKFDYEVIFSKNKINPIPDFLHKCRYVFLTEDSTSMISEAVCTGSAYIEIIPLKAQKKDNKFNKFIQNIVHLKAAHIYDGGVGKSNMKIDLENSIRKVLE
jgi:mitochondrial fission protein ELM1